MKKNLLYVSFVLCFLPILMISNTTYAQSQKDNLFSQNPVIANVDSEPIRIQDIEDKKINELRTQLYEALVLKIQSKSLEKLAKKYPKYAVEPKINISDQHVKQFYDSRGLQSRGSFEELKPRIKSFLMLQTSAIHLEKLYKKALRDGLIVSHLQQPNPFLIQALVETAYLRGNRNAQLMVLEFSDYQCPFCSRVQPTIQLLRKKYGNKLIFAYRHSPLPFHKEADEAAIAAECARDQGKFEPYHDMLFENYRTINFPNLKRFAKKVGIKNLKVFNQCLDQEKYRTRLENDQKAAAAAGIRGTPGFIIGTYNKKHGMVKGEMISGAQPLSAFIELIDKYLK